MLKEDCDFIFTDWAKPASDTETEKSERAKRMIYEAIHESDLLQKREISVFVQGSYRNNTNIKGDSDVDICVCCHDIFLPNYTWAPYLSNAKLNFINSTYKYADFKYEVGQALIRKFGQTSVTKGNKAFDIHANSCRVDADVVPAIEFRGYYNAGNYHIGTQIYTDSGFGITNWPEQHYSNGVKKNNDTNYRFKYIVRVIKNLCLFMQKNKIAPAFSIPSYLIECLVYNVPNYLFGNPSYKTDVNNCLQYIHEKLSCGDNYVSLLEVNGIKYLFHETQKWTIIQVKDFILSAWRCINAK